MNWKFAVPLTKRVYSGTQTASVASALISAAQRAAPARASPSASVRMPPRMGSQITTDSKPMACM